MAYIKYILTFVLTVHTTLPVRTAYQSVSFAFRLAPCNRKDGELSIKHRYLEIAREFNLSIK